MEAISIIWTAWAKSLPSVTVYLIQIAISMKAIHWLSIACYWVNSQAGFEAPIHAILCDGKSLHFFKFDERRDKTPRFLRGRFERCGFEIPVPRDFDYEADPKLFIGHNRCVSEVLYYVFLVGYVTGLEAHWRRSVAEGKAKGQARPSTPSWHKALDMARECLEEATRASTLGRNDKMSESQEAADRAHQLLIERYMQWFPLRSAKIDTDNWA